VRLKLFYSWQSDTDERTNRYLVRDTLDELSHEFEQGLDIDEATRDVPGSPAIGESIVRKIDSCAFFVPDLTVVGKYSEKKFTPNPNVLIEYGYALRSKGDKQIIPFMNYHYGDPEQLPFDLRFRAIRVNYKLEPTAEVSDRLLVRAQLKGHFAREIRLTLNSTLFGGLSQSSISAIEMLVTQSADGALRRPEVSFADLCSQLGISDDEARSVIDELEGQKLVERKFGLGGERTPSIRPSDGLFWRFDRVFKGWTTEDDALEIAVRLVGGTARQFVSIKLAGELGWEPRRLNPALTYLVRHGIVGQSEMNSYPFAVHSILETPETRRFVRQP
jgi:hypothetical protein